jgi:murein DD-endopeptidase MepM/ murein hydrolase activator NlpD
MARLGVGASVLVACVLAAGCGRDAAPTAAAAPEPAPASTAATPVTEIAGTVVADIPTTVSSTAAAPPPPTAPATTLAPVTTATTRPRVRAVVQTGFSPFATVGGVTLSHPAATVERVGFHESNHDGARQMEALPTAAAPITVESRERGTGNRTAADIVVAPGTEIRSPVTGRVKRAGGYVLYCKHSDDFVVIEPDAHPGWEVKILHIDGERVTAGQRVTAGETLLAPRATQLPFESQVDEYRTADPAWPHVHIEVVDPTIKDRPSPGGGCS